ncbi:MAG: dienelactone hydrolase family protein [Halobacteriota archaeon]|nr:dienelactone hydrolase family protein [Halobacteriota archaeon]
MILCPPHPMFGGSRYDARLVHLAKELGRSGISALCIDYGKYGGGAREARDVMAAISHMKGEAKKLGVLGYSFGAVVSSNAVAQSPHKIDGYVAMSILKRIEKVSADLSSNCPKLMIHGRKDPLAPFKDFESLFSDAKGEKEQFVLETDHFYGGVMDLVSERVCDFFRRVLL